MSKLIESKTRKHMKIIGDNLRRFRYQACLSQEEVGEMLGISYQQVQKYEVGINRLSAERLFHLRHIYDVPYMCFFEGLPLSQAVKTSHKSRMPDIWDEVRDPALRRKIEKIIGILMG